MSTKRATKRALLTSILAICLCLVMLIGSTFAWFTDTASTGVNKIQSGTLKVDIVKPYKDANDKYPSLEGKKLEFQKAGDAEEGEDVLWEPGCTYVTEGFKIKNDGNLALKWKAEVNKDKAENGRVDNAEVTTGKSLLDVIDFYVVTDNTKKDAEAVSIDKFVGNLKADELSDETYYIMGRMQESAGNDYQGLTLDNISITVYATQDTVENDSFNNQYDKAAYYYDKDTAYQGSRMLTTVGTYVLSDGAVVQETDENPIAVFASGEGTDVTITGGYYDGGSGRDYNVAIWANEGAKVTIKDGYFTVGANKDGDTNSVIYSIGGNITIEGGFFQTDCATASGWYYVLNQNNSNPGTITVKGGTFVNYDPSKGDDNLGGSFVAPGYKVVSENQTNGDTWYTVVAE